MILGLFDRVFFQFYRLYVDSNKDIFAAWFFTVLWFSLTVVLLIMATLLLISSVRYNSVEGVNGFLAMKIAPFVLLFSMVYVLIRKSVILSRFENITARDYKNGKVLLIIYFAGVLIYNVLVALICKSIGTIQ